MYKTGLHASYWGASELEGNLRQLIDLYPKLGLEIIEIPVTMVAQYSDAEFADLRKLLADHGLTLMFNGGVDPSLDIAHSDPQIRAVAVEHVKHLLDLVSKAGSSIFSGVNYSVWKRLPDRPITEDEKKAIAGYSIGSLEKILPVAESLGIDYAFETVNRYEHFLLNTVGEGIAFCKALDSPAAKLQLDTFHMNIEELNMYDAMRNAEENGVFAHFHLGEPDRSVPGIRPSHMDWQKIFATLKEIGYTGGVSIEPFIRMETTRNYRACVWRQLASNDLEARCDQIRQSVHFLHSLQ